MIFPNSVWSKFFQKSDFGIFALIPLCNGGNIQFRLTQFFNSYFLVCFVVFTFCSTIHYDIVIHTIWTFLYYITVRICAQYIIIIFLQLQKYSVPPTAPIEVVTNTSSIHLPHLNIQRCISQYIAHYHKSFSPDLFISDLYSPPSLSHQSNIYHTSQ